MGDRAMRHAAAPCGDCSRGAPLCRAPARRPPPAHGWQTTVNDGAPVSRVVCHLPLGQGGSACRIV